MTIQLSRANSGRPLTTADYNSDNLIVETAVNALQSTTSSNGTVTSVSDVDTDVAELFSTSIATETSTPVITYSRTSKAANLVYASPNGTSGKPTMRALVSGDLPVVPANKGGTGLGTIQANKVLRGKGDGSVLEYAGIVPSSSSRIVVTPTVSNYELDIVPANIEIDTLAATTKLSIAKGGTGKGTAQLAINALASVSIADSGKALIVDSNGDVKATPFAAGVSSVNSSTGAVVLTTTDINEGTRLYYTDGRVDSRIASNSAVIANTAKVTNATHTGDVTGSTVLTLATVNSNVGTFNNVTVNAKGLITAASNASYEAPLTFSSGLTRSTNTVTIGTGAVTNAMLANGAVANLSGVNTGDQINITGNAATVTTNANLIGVVTSIGNTTSIPNAVITNAMLANSAVSNLSGINTGDNAVNSLYSGLVTNATHTGEVTGSGALTIANNVVTYAKMQAVGASKILGNPTTSTANTSEIGIGGNLLFSSTKLIQKQSVVGFVTANYSILPTDGNIYADATSASFTVTLPNVSNISIGDIFFIKRINSGGNSVTVAVHNASTDLIDGESNYGLTGIYHFISVQYVGVVGGKNTWYIISEKPAA